MEPEAEPEAGVESEAEAEPEAEAEAGVKAGVDQLWIQHLQKRSLQMKTVSVETRKLRCYCWTQNLDPDLGKEGGRDGCPSCVNI